MPVHGNVYAGFNAANKSLATIGELAALKDEQQTRELQRYAAAANLQRLDDDHRQQLQAEERAQRIQQLAQKHSEGGVFDQEAFLHDLQSTGDLEAMQIANKALSESNNIVLANDKARRDANVQQGLEMSAELRDLTPENAAALYPARRAKLIAKHKELEADLPEQFDPVQVGHLVQAPLTHEQWVKDVDTLKKDAKDTVDKFVVDLATSDSPEDIQRIYALAAKVGVPQALTDLVGPPDRVIGMTPDDRRHLLFQASSVKPENVMTFLSQEEQRKQQAANAKLQAENTAADNTRQDLAGAETRRHNLIMEGQGSQRIANGAAANAPLPMNLPPQAAAVADRVLVGVPGTRTGAIKQGLSNLAQRGASEDQIKSYLRLAAVETLGQADKTAMVGRMQTISALKDAESVLQQVPTGMIKGTWEDTMRALGTTSDPRMVELGTRMGTILANYMRSISGAAIADKEADRLGKLIPNYRNSLAVNMGQIKGFSDTLRSFDNAFYQYKFGDNYDWVMGTQEKGGGGAAAPAPAGVGRVRVKGPNGQTGTMPSTSSLPPGWSVVK